MQNSISVLDLVRVGIVFLVAVSAASLAYLALLRAERGRIREAVAYLAGFLAGVAATIGLVNLLGSFATADAPIAHAGMLASFIGPFAGMAHAELRLLAVEESASWARPRWPDHGEGVFADRSRRAVGSSERRQYAPFLPAAEAQTELWSRLEQPVANSRWLPGHSILPRSPAK
jgi:hypothetical protein